MNKFKINKTIDQINMVATNIRTLYSSQKTYAGLNNKIAKLTGSIPAEMYTNASDSTITNPFGGAMYLTPATQSGTANDSFVIGIDNVPESACVSIATTEWGADAGSGLIGLFILDSKATKPTAALATTVFTNTTIAASSNGVSLKGVDHLPYSIVDASTGCTRGTYPLALAWKYL
jgi:hypothetical protein